MANYFLQCEQLCNYALLTLGVYSALRIYGNDAERAALIKEQVHTVAALERRFSTDALQKGA